MCEDLQHAYLRAGCSQAAPQFVHVVLYHLLNEDGRRTPRIVSLRIVQTSFEYPLTVRLQIMGGALPQMGSDRLGVLLCTLGMPGVPSEWLLIAAACHSPAHGPHWDCRLQLTSLHPHHGNSW